MATAEALDRFRPLHDAHAIEQLVATIQFEHPLSDDSIRAGILAMSEFHDVLPAAHEIRGVGFHFGPAGVVPLPSAQGNMPDGQVRFITDHRGVVLNELRLERQTLVFRTQAYSRWDAVWADARRYFERVLQSLVEPRIASFGLLYVDKFVWNGAAESCRPVSLFRPGSPYLTPQSLVSLDMWHCHSGQFRSVGSDVKRLEVVDIDCLDEILNTQQVPPQAERVVRISTHLTDRFNQLGYAPRQIDGSNAMEVANEAFPVLHTELKRVFSEILSDEYALRVGMKKNDRS